MNTTPCLHITGLEKRYRRFALGPIDLTVPTGTIYGLIGPNGAGKSTLIDSIFGMASPDAGSIKVSGLDHVRDDVAVKQRAAYMGPDLNFLGWGKVGRAVRFMRGFRPTWDDAYAAQLMEKLGLNAADKIFTLSFGGRTKLALLMALAWKPQVLVLDEPTTGLDAHAKKLIFGELLAIVKDEARTVLISSHQITDLERFADRVGILHKGRMVVDGNTNDLVERFVQIEFTAPPDFTAPSGLSVQEKDGQRWRAVLDTQATPMTAFAQCGASDVREQSLTLEELFIALTL
jgi:ABC-2 type transport system ATP-binding protein